MFKFYEDIHDWMIALKTFSKAPKSPKSTSKAPPKNDKVNKEFEFGAAHLTARESCAAEKIQVSEKSIQSFIGNIFSEQAGGYTRLF